MPGLFVKEAETKKELAGALTVRRKVFVEKQKIPEGIELDGKDSEALGEVKRGKFVTLQKAKSG